eukprot:9971559-Karenia_brevis.AAC.1
MPGVHDVPVGWCDHGLVSLPGVSSRIITNVDDAARSLKTNSKCAENLRWTEVGDSSFHQQSI